MLIEAQAFIDKGNKNIYKREPCHGFKFLLVDSKNMMKVIVGQKVKAEVALDQGSLKEAKGGVREVGGGIYAFDAEAEDTDCKFGHWVFSSDNSLGSFVNFITLEKVNNA